MRSQVRLGKVFGIRVGLHYSWFLIALLIVFSISSQLRATNPGWSESLTLAVSAATAVLFFVSLLLHELAHSLVAVSHGLPVREITLFALGGVSQIEKNPASAGVEFRMALAGPLTSAAIGLICLGLVHLSRDPASNPGTAMLLWLGYINLTLAGFNMIPGYPLDGGRVLRAIIWWKTGSEDRSTQLASKVGQAVAFGMIALGIFEFFSGAGLGGLWMAFIGWFLLQASGESYLRVGLAHAMAGAKVSDIMTRDCMTVDGLTNLQDFIEHQMLPTGRRCFIVLTKGEFAGLITAHEIKGIERSRWPYLTLHDVMLPLEDLHSVKPDTPLPEAFESMNRYDLNQLPVVANDHFEGLLSRAQLLGYLRTHLELHKGLP
jgi:Zn-dependent protease/CBS domain-containing protein